MKGPTSMESTTHGTVRKRLSRSWPAMRALLSGVVGLMMVLGAPAALAQASACRVQQHGAAGTFDFGPAGGGITASAALSNMTLDSSTSGSVEFFDNNGRGYQTPPSSTRWLLTNSNSLTRIVITFSAPIPAHRLGITIEDLGTGSSLTLPPYDPRMTLSVSGGATPSGFVGHVLNGATQAIYTPATGQVSMAPRSLANPATLRQSVFLRGDSANLVTSITLTASGILSGDFVGIRLVSIPSCVRISKVTEGSTGSFGFTTSGLSTWTNAAPGTVSLATTVIGTAVESSRLYYAAGIPGSGIGTAPVTLTESIPAGWRLTGSQCNDANAGRNGNTGSFGTLSGGVLTIPGDRMRFESDITCTFTNARDIDLAIVKSATPTTVTTGGLVTFTLTASNLTAGSVVQDATLRDTPSAGLDCTEAGLPAPTCSVTGDAQCPAPAALTASALTSAGGVVVPRIAGGASVAISLQCRVNASGE